MSLSQDALAYIRASYRWGDGMPTTQEISRHLGRPVRNVALALEVLTINGYLKRVPQTPGARFRLMYALAERTRK